MSISSRQDGGPAYPQAVSVGPSGDVYKSGADGIESGMSLRDYFAAQITAGAMVNATGLAQATDAQLDEMGRLIFRLADAMLAAREK